MCQTNLKMTLLIEPQLKIKKQDKQPLKAATNFPNSDSGVLLRIARFPTYFMCLFAVGYLQHSHPFCSPVLV